MSRQQVAAPIPSRARRIGLVAALTCACLSASTTTGSAQVSVLGKKLSPDAELRLGVHGSAGLSISYLRGRPDRWKAFGVELGMDWEMWNVSLLDGTCTYGLPDGSSYAYECSRHVWNALHLSVFLLARKGDWYTVEVGPSATAYLNGDEGAEAGMLLGPHVAGEIGYRFVFVGAGTRFGLATDPFYGTAFDAVWSPHVRFVLGRGR